MGEWRHVRTGEGGTVQRIPRENLNAVFDDDLMKVLEDLGLWKKFERGEEKCKFCRASVDLSNLTSLFKQSGDIKFVCDSPECLHALYLMLRNGEVTL
jgi:hypothetical protein